MGYVRSSYYLLSLSLPGWYFLAILCMVNSRTFYLNLIPLTNNKIESKLTTNFFLEG